MRKILLFILLCTFSLYAFASREAKIQEYIDNYKEWAMLEQVRSGVPAAIKLAQGIHETAAGTSELAINAKNHFGVKCRGNNWSGKSYSYTDDKPDECFRAYDSEYFSYKDHSDFLRNNKRYASLFTLKNEDYHAWCKGLKAAGYATNPHYAQLLIKYIEEFNLQEYTLKAIENEAYYTSLLEKGEVPEKVSQNKTYAYAGKELEEKENIEYYTQTTKNGLKGFYARKGDLLLESAINFRIRYVRLLQINELEDAPLDYDMFIYLEPKLRISREEDYYTIKEGENLQLISQKTGVQLKSLKALNGVENEKAILSKGEKVYLKNNRENALSIVENQKENLPIIEENNRIQEEDEFITINHSKKQKEERVEIVEKLNKTQGAKIVESEEKGKEVIDYGYGAVPTSEKKESYEEEKDLSPLDRLKAHMDKNVYGANDNVNATKEKKNHVVNSYETRPAGTHVVDRANQQESTSNGYYTVKKGDTAYGISKRFGISLKELNEWNDLKGNLSVKIGQSLRVQAP